MQTISLADGCRMTFCSRPRCAGLALLVVGWHLAAAADPPAEKKPVSPAEVAKLDAKVKDVSESFLRDTTALISSYEDIGEYERAKVLLEALRKLNPGNEAVKKKLADLDRRQLDAGEFAVEIDPGKPWVAVGVVRKDRPIRIRVTGEYRFTASATVGANGMAAKDPASDLVPGVVLGAVLGVIAPPTAAADQPGRPPKPFLVGSEYERPADADGILYLKANVPVDTKCTGRLEALVSGATKP
jgi:hypothetical protein